MSYWSRAWQRQNGHSFFAALRNQLLTHSWWKMWPHISLLIWHGSSSDVIGNLSANLNGTRHIEQSVCVVSLVVATCLFSLDKSSCRMLRRCLSICSRLTSWFRIRISGRCRSVTFGGGLNSLFLTFELTVYSHVINVTSLQGGCIGHFF